MKTLTALSTGIVGIMLLGASTHAATSIEIGAANTLSSNGIISEQETSAGYNLSSNITRKEIMKVVMNLSGKTVTDQCNREFPDVNNDWGCKYIEAALENSFIAKNATFRPNDTITKAESMKLILKARGIDKTHNGDDWRENYMLTAYDAGVISEKYNDHDTKSTRGWIFSAAVGGESTTQETSNQNEQSDIEEENQIEESNETLTENLVEINTSDITTGYYEYNESLIGSNKTTVLFFNASWCPSCIISHHSLESTDFEGENILILSVDYDSNKDLRKDYGVTSQHTFVQVDMKGTLLKKWVGGMDLEDIKAKTQ